MEDQQPNEGDKKIVHVYPLVKVSNIYILIFLRTFSDIIFETAGLLNGWGCLKIESPKFV